MSLASLSIRNNPLVVPIGDNQIAILGGDVSGKYLSDGYIYESGGDPQD